MGRLGIEGGYPRRVQPANFLVLGDTGQQSLEDKTIRVDRVHLVGATAGAGEVERVDLGAQRIAERADTGHPEIHLTSGIRKFIAGRESRSLTVDIGNRIGQEVRASITDIDPDGLEEVVLDIEEAGFDRHHHAGRPAEPLEDLRKLDMVLKRRQRHELATGMDSNSFDLFLPLCFAASVELAGDKTQQLILLVDVSGDIALILVTKGDIGGGIHIA